MILDYRPSDLPDSVGLHFIIGLDGSELSENDKQILGRLKPGGILLKSHNFAYGSYGQWLNKLDRLIRDVQQYTERESLLISLDHEGGVLHNAPAPITHFGSPYSFRNHVELVAKAMCTEVKSFGVNTLWAPVADINWNPKNPVIGPRAFGKSPLEVVTPIIQTIKTYKENEVLSCAKHYPGHGGTSEDSHYTLPYLDCDLVTLMQRDLIPFKESITAGVPLIMTAHVMFPRIDSLYPATLSNIFLNEIARKEFGFSGIMVADNINMDSVTKIFRDSSALVTAMNATIDTFIVSDKTERALALGKDLVDARRRREISESVLIASHQRIAKIYGTLKPPSFCKLSENVLLDHAALGKELI
jgi:beta-N-acetylhexosaminidase